MVPDILTTEHFSDPELQVMVQDGLVRRLGHWYCPIRMPDSVSLRARAVAIQFGRSVIADTLTAAWIYQCSDILPDRLTGCVPREHRSAATRRLGDVREVVIDDADIDAVGVLRLTTPLRTFRDICRLVPQRGEKGYSTPRERYHRLIAAALVVRFAIRLDTEIEQLRPAVPHTARARTMIERLGSLLAQVEALPADRRIPALLHEQVRLHPLAMSR